MNHPVDNHRLKYIHQGLIECVWNCKFRRCFSKSPCSLQTIATWLRKSPKSRLILAIWDYLGWNDSLRIQIYPKKGISPTYVFWGWDWDYQSLSKEGSESPSAIQSPRSEVHTFFVWQVAWEATDDCKLIQGGLYLLKNMNTYKYGVPYIYIYVYCEYSTKYTKFIIFKLRIQHVYACD